MKKKSVISMVAVLAIIFAATFIYKTFFQSKSIYISTVQSRPSADTALSIDTTSTIMINTADIESID